MDDPPFFNDEGIIFTGIVTTPTHFTVLGTGGWNWVQLVSTSRHRVNQHVNQSMVKNGQQGLDSTYPYEPGPYTSHPGTAGEHAATTQPRSNKDTPGEGLFDVSRELEGVNTLDSFRTWLMYLPPGADSRYVPIRKIKWFWHGAAIRKAPTVWGMTSSPDDCGWDFDGDKYPEHPQWRVRIEKRDLTDYTPRVP